MFYYILNIRRWRPRNFCWRRFGRLFFLWRRINRVWRHGASSTIVTRRFWLLSSGRPSPTPRWRPGRLFSGQNEFKSNFTKRSMRSNVCGKKVFLSNLILIESYCSKILEGIAICIFIYFLYISELQWWIYWSKSQQQIKSTLVVTSSKCLMIEAMIFFTTNHQPQ